MPASAIRFIDLSVVDVGACDRKGKFPHSKNIGRAFSHSNPTACIEHVKNMGALETVVQCRDYQARIKQRLRKLLILLKQSSMESSKVLWWLVDPPKHIL